MNEADESIYFFRQLALSLPRSSVFVAKEDQVMPRGDYN